MHKHSTVILLSVLVVFLSVYIFLDARRDRQHSMVAAQAAVATQTASSAETPAAIDDGMDAPDGGPIKYYPDEYVLIPELQIGFHKIDGLTVRYMMSEDGKTVSFYSDEVKAAAQKDQGIASCVKEMFPKIATSTLSLDETEYKGYLQTRLADKRYLNIYNPQAVCYTKDASPADILLVQLQTALFSQSVRSAQSY